MRHFCEEQKLGIQEHTPTVHRTEPEVLAKEPSKINRNIIPASVQTNLGKLKKPKESKYLYIL